MRSTRNFNGVFNGAEVAAVAPPTLLSFSSRVADPVPLKQFIEGNKVRCSADRVGGQLTATRMRKGR